MSACDWLIEIRNRCTTELESIRHELDFYERHRSLCAEARIAALKEMQQRLLEEKLRLSNVFDLIPDPVARAIYRWRYTTCGTWGLVAEKCGGMSERNAHYIHDHWLPEVERLYKESTAPAAAVEYGERKE